MVVFYQFEHFYTCLLEWRAANGEILGTEQLDYSISLIPSTEPFMRSSYQTKAPPFAIRQPGNEPHSPPRTTTPYESHVSNDNDETVNTTLSEAAFQSPLNDSIISNSFHGFTSPASRASLNSSTCLFLL